MNRVVTHHERSLVVAVLRACAEDLPGEFDLKRKCFELCAAEIEARPLAALPPIRSSSSASEPVSLSSVTFDSLEVAMLWDAARRILHNVRLRHRTAELLQAVPLACQALSSRRTDAPTREEILEAAEALVKFDPKCAVV